MTTPRTVKALHIVTPTKEFDKCKQVMYKVFHRSSTDFPLHMKLTFVPLAITISSEDGLELLHKQRNKQGIFNNMMAKSFAMNFEIANLDMTTEHSPSLRSILMCTMSKEYCDQPLFVSVDNDFKNENQVNFSFIPKVQQEARQFIANMVPILLNSAAGPHIELFFHTEAVLRGKQCLWDVTTQSVMNSDEAYLQSFQDFDDDDITSDKYDIRDQLHPESAQERVYGKIQNNFVGQETDSVGTIKTNSNTYTPSAPSVIDDSLRSVYTEARISTNTP